MSLPAHRFDACIKRSGVVDKYQTVIFETNRYSVPHTVERGKQNACTGARESPALGTIK
jgi:hypothetical protein